MNGLTRRQAQILELIRTHIQEEGRPPTRAEISSIIGFKSANAAEEHLKALARKGAIEMIPGASRGIRVLDEPDAGIPLIGSVAAGFPILASENIEKRLELQKGLFSQQPDFLLRVRGLSMKDAGILEGDLLAVRKTSEIRNGSISVVRIDDEVTVKTVHQLKNILILEPANSEFETMRIDLSRQSAEIEGEVVGVIRTSL